MTDVASCSRPSRVAWLDFGHRLSRLGPNRSFQIAAWILIAVAIVRWLGMSGFDTLGLFAVFNTALLVFAIGRFARVYFSDVWAPFAALLVLLFAWGEPWAWTGGYDLRALFYNAADPWTFVLGLTFASWTIALRAIRCDEIGWLGLLAIAALTAFMVVSHRLGAAFAFGGIALFLMFEPLAGARVRLAIVVAAIVGVAAGLLCAPIFEGAAAQTPDDRRVLSEPHRALLLFGPCLLGFFGIVRMTLVRRRHTLLVGFAGALIVTVIGGMVGEATVHRLLVFAAVFLHLGLVWEILERQKGRAGTKVSNASLLLFGFFWALLQTILAVAI